MTPYLSVEDAAAGLAAARFSATELAEYYADRISDQDPKLNAMVERTSGLARAQAAASDARRAAGMLLSPLDGVPYTLKDVFCARDFPVHAASRMLAGWTAPYDSTVYARLRDAGAVLLATVNTDEFTMGASGETSAYGATRNPWDRERVAGGSSSGPAAAVAAGYGCFSVGTDTGGSIRQPAAFCGVTGIRPTYGRISRYGEIAMASSLDQAGPLARTAQGAAMVLHVLSGHDPLDATSDPAEVPDYSAALGGDLRGIKIGVPAELFAEGVDPEVAASVMTAIEELTQAGGRAYEISLPEVPDALAAYYVLAPAEVSSNMARYDGVRFGHRASEAADLSELYARSRSEGFGTEVKRRVVLGTHALSAGRSAALYQRAETARARVTEGFRTAFRDVDLIASPTAPHTAFKLGEKLGNPLAMYMEDVLTVPVNVGGVPGISIPCGPVRGLPVGLQLIGPRLGEPILLKAAAAYQLRTGYHLAEPPL